MSAVLASYVKMSTLVDGTMRIVLDVEPTAAPEAFAMLGAPGSPIALARITDAAAVAQDRKAQAELPPQLNDEDRKIVQKAGMLCREHSFYTFLKQSEHYRDALPEGKGNFPDHCAEALRNICMVESRRDIGSYSRSKLAFEQLEATYHDWQRRRAA